MFHDRDHVSILGLGPYVLHPPLPDDRIPPLDLPHAVEGNVALSSLLIDHNEREIVPALEIYVFKPHPLKRFANAVIVSDGVLLGPEVGVPTYLVQEF